MPRSETIMWLGGLFSQMPETTWWGSMVACAAEASLHAALRVEADEPIRIVASQASALAVHCCSQREGISEPTWRYRNRITGERWRTPGGCGPGDSDLLTTLHLQPGVPASLGAFESPTVLILRRVDNSPAMMSVEAIADLATMRGCHVG